MSDNELIYLTLESLSFLAVLLSRRTGEEGLLLSLSRRSRCLFLRSADSLRLFLLREFSRPDDPDLTLLLAWSLLLKVECMWVYPRQQYDR